MFANLVYAGPLEEGLALIKPLLDLGPFQQNITMVPWKDLQTAARFNTSRFACAKGGLHDVWGLNLYQIDVPTLVSAVEYMDGVYAEYPDFRESFLAIDLYAGRVTQSIPDDATAYPYRNAVARL